MRWRRKMMLPTMLLAHVLIGETPKAGSCAYPPLAWPSRVTPFQRADDEPEQEEGPAAEHHGESRLGCPDRPRRHRGGRVRALPHDGGAAGSLEGHRRHRAL